MEELEVSFARVKYDGVFKLSEYYQVLFDLFRGMGYDVEEKNYKTKKSPSGDEVEIIWECYKRVDDYTRLKIWVKTLIVGLQSTKARVDGKEVPRDKGNVELTLNGYIQTDYRNTWETNPFLKFLKGVYDKYIYRSNLENWESKVEKEMHEVENEMKSLFHMERFM